MKIFTAHFPIDANTTGVAPWWSHKKKNEGFRHIHITYQTLKLHIHV